MGQCVAAALPRRERAPRRGLAAPCKRWMPPRLKDTAASLRVSAQFHFLGALVRNKLRGVASKNRVKSFLVIIVTEIGQSCSDAKCQH